MTDVSKLDIERFRKVLALVENGVDGERGAARAAADRIAAAAGLTFDQARNICRQNPTQHAPREASSTEFARNFFHDLFNDPVFRAQREQREKRDEIRREELLREFGSEDAILADTPREAALSAAVDHLKVWSDFTCTLTGEVHRSVSSLDGCNNFHRFDRVPESVIQAVSEAYSIPLSLSEVLEEYLDWDELYLRRQLFGPCDHWYWVQARMLILENILAHRPVQNWRDMQARMRWWQVIADRGMHHPEEWEELRLRIEQDHLILQRNAAQAQPNRPRAAHRTNRDKAADVIDLIKSNPDMSTRELARRAGVSPQTVLNWKNRMSK